jgi:glycogen debranching enzyme
VSPDPDPRERRGLLPRFTLKDENCFLLADAMGDVQGYDEGLFTDDTRMLSRYELQIADGPASLLGAAVSQDNTLFTAHLTNHPLPALGEQVIPRGIIHIERNRFLSGACLYEQLVLTNYSEDEASLPLKLLFAADFVDIFEVQGHARPKRGELLPARIDDAAVRLAYRGLDDRVRTTHIAFSRTPVALSAGSAAFLLPLKRGAVAELYVRIGSESPNRCGPENHRAAARRLTASMQRRIQDGASISTSGRLFNQWIDRSRSDLALLTTPLPTGPYPYAGIPWFATQFGRDALITSLQTLWLNPSLAAGVLKFLASTQAREEATFSDSQPGKIMHETRRGEMAALREVPFGKYYGGVDSTPLFLMLAGAYERCTSDAEIVNEIWPQVIAAMQWIERRLDASPTGFLDYACGESSGLINQSWKDSHDSIFHADGRIPHGPIAVVEVQGYVYEALNAMAELAAARGESLRSSTCRERAKKMRAAIEREFWIPELQCYAIALDGVGAPCKVLASNAGHLLFCGVPSEAHARAVAEQLSSSAMSSGWGIRTLAQGQSRFNPMSYHNGSVWPHDTAVCAAGMARYGNRAQVLRILSEVFEAAVNFNMRLPELYCGFARIEGQGPAPYPVACLPQAWACGSVFMLLQAALGLRIDGARKAVHVEQPMLPIGVESLDLRDLPVGSQRIDLTFRRIGEDVVVAPLKPLPSGVHVLTHL